eukprot:TRINITY_DN4522_c0_g1_i2.p1 TRINITY_DN4522_c0_g1~~TRINITY_DN4522_c0_g1_i2.p1  ORF type:complete len:1116 (+),score=292.39 TRINITY_DN4522_c0_g1_i2:68-3349(+)
MRRQLQTPLIDPEAGPAHSFALPDSPLASRSQRSGSDFLASSVRGEEDDVRKGCCTAKCHRAADMEPPYPRHFQYHVSPLERHVFQYVFASAFDGEISPSALFALLRGASSVLVNCASIWINFFSLGGRDESVNYNLSRFIVAYFEFAAFHLLLLWGLYRIHSVVRRGREVHKQFSPEDLATAADHMRTRVQRLSWDLIIQLGQFQTFMMLDYFRPPKIRSLLMKVRTLSGGAVLPRLVNQIIVPGYIVIGCLSVMAVFVKLSQVWFIFRSTDLAGGQNATYVDPQDEAHPLCLGGHPCWDWLWYIKFAGFFNNLLRLDRSEYHMVELLQHVCVGHYAPSFGVQSDKADNLVTSFYEQMFKGGKRNVGAFSRFIFFAELSSAQLLRYLEMCEGVGSGALRSREQLQYFINCPDGAQLPANRSPASASLGLAGTAAGATKGDVDTRKREALRAMDPVRANPITNVDSSRMPRVLRAIDNYAYLYLRRGFIRPVTFDLNLPEQGPPPGVFVSESKERLGGLCVTVERAYELLETEWSVGKLTGAEGCDPYVLVHAYPSKLRCRTSTRRNTLFPDFNESFQLPIPQKQQAVELQVSVYDEGSSIGGFMGFASLVVPGHELYAGKRRHRLQLGPRKGNAADRRRFARTAQSGHGFGFVDVVLYARTTADVQENSDEQLHRIFHVMPTMDVEETVQPSQLDDSPNWVCDKDAANCRGCNKKFTFTLRRHHCRLCGGVFCNACSRHREVLTEFGQQPQRICDDCKAQLGKPVPAAKRQKKEIRLEDLRQTFDRVDDDNSGSIDKEEIELIRPMLKYMGVSDEEVAIILGSADHNDDGLLDFDEFVTIFEDMLGYNVKKPEEQSPAKGAVGAAAEGAVGAAQRLSLQNGESVRLSMLAAEADELRAAVDSVIHPGTDNGTPAAAGAADGDGGPPPAPPWPPPGEVKVGEDVAVDQQDASPATAAAGGAGARRPSDATSAAAPRRRGDSCAAPQLPPAPAPPQLPQPQQPQQQQRQCAESPSARPSPQQVTLTTPQRFVPFRGHSGSPGDLRTLSPHRPVQTPCPLRPRDLAILARGSALRPPRMVPSARSERPRRATYSL